MKMSKENQVKNLREQIAVCENKLKHLSEQLILIGKTQCKWMEKSENLQSQLDKITTPIEIKFLEHAIYRYLQRVDTSQFNRIKQDILTSEMVEMINMSGGSGKFTHKDGYLVVVENGTIKTIMFKEEKQ
jgi:hypothetical protein